MSTWSWVSPTPEELSENQDLLWYSCFWHCCVYWMFLRRCPAAQNLASEYISIAMLPPPHNLKCLAGVYNGHVACNLQFHSMHAPTIYIYLNLIYLGHTLECAMITICCFCCFCCCSSSDTRKSTVHIICNSNHIATTQKHKKTLVASLSNRRVEWKTYYCNKHWSAAWSPN